LPRPTVKIVKGKKNCADCIYCRVVSRKGADNPQVRCKKDIWLDSGFNEVYSWGKTRDFVDRRFTAKVCRLANSCKHYKDESEKGRSVWQKTGMIAREGQWFSEWRKKARVYV